MALPFPHAHNSSLAPASFPNRFRETVLLLLMLLLLLLLLLLPLMLCWPPADAVTTTTLGYWMLGRRLFCSLIITTTPFFDFRFYYYHYHPFYTSHLYAHSFFSHTIMPCPHRCLAHGICGACTSFPPWRTSDRGTCRGICSALPPPSFINFSSERHQAYNIRYSRNNLPIPTSDSCHSSPTYSPFWRTLDPPSPHRPPKKDNKIGSTKKKRGQSTRGKRLAGIASPRRKQWSQHQHQQQHRHGYTAIIEE